MPINMKMNMNTNMKIPSYTIPSYTTPINEEETEYIRKANQTIIGGVQGHGKQWENEIIAAIVAPKNHTEAYSQPYTAMYDIPGHLNNIHPNVNISIKSTGTNSVGFGDAKRTIINIENTKDKMAAIIVVYKQIENQKHPIKVIHIDLTKGRQALLGSMPSEELHERVEKLDRMVKSGDPQYKTEAKQLQQDMKRSGAALMVAPKIGNKEKGRSGRLQISLANLNEFIEGNPHLVISDNSCKVYGKECLSVIESGKRTFTPKDVATDK